MPRRHRADENSAGGVLARPSAGGWEVCLVRADRYWGLPKGHIEPGETAAQAALREMSEECGVALAALELVTGLSSSEYVYRRGGRLIFKRVEYFLVTAPAGTTASAQPGEIDEVEWLSFEQARERASFADTRTALDAARRELAEPAG
jgi:8-oxo-dGTP pyrophosphatase MutT (NUDIX family)